MVQAKLRSWASFGFCYLPARCELYLTAFFVLHYVFFDFCPVSAEYLANYHIYLSDPTSGNMKSSGVWRNKPLFRREGDARFKTGKEAADMLVQEAIRRDGHEEEFVATVSSTLSCLGTVFDRSPKYAWIAKQLLEPERLVHFRVAWIDDVGVMRMNRGFRVQYSSAAGPYEVRAGRGWQSGGGDGVGEGDCYFWVHGVLPPPRNSET